jgi:hypothetical protein
MIRLQGNLVCDHFASKNCGAETIKCGGRHGVAEQAASSPIAESWFVHRRVSDLSDSGFGKHAVSSSPTRMGGVEGRGSSLGSESARPYRDRLWPWRENGGQAIYTIH